MNIIRIHGSRCTGKTTTAQAMQAVLLQSGKRSMIISPSRKLPEFGGMQLPDCMIFDDCEPPPHLLEMADSVHEIFCARTK